jgi:hypothetical protein
MKPPPGGDGCSVTSVATGRRQRQGELANQSQAVRGVQDDVFAHGGQLDAAADLDLGHGLILQQCRCQCRRAARSSASPRMPSARQVTV